MKVAAYCRVSTDKDDQANSFEAQQRYFREYIANRPDWELHEVYADEGITGTSTKKRAQFNRMIGDAHEGKFQLIITKEVSRFSRNILDTIQYTRELKAIGVGVQFVLDGINTLSPDAELYLAIMASMAQEESRKTSSRVVWGQTRQMERGVVFGQSLLGYDVRGGKISIEPEGAEIVRLIFKKYAIEQVSTSEIARYLTAHGFRTSRGGEWNPSAIIKILNNEKYVGDLIQKKTYTPDYLTHEKKANRGQVPLIRIKNHHEPIISRELWDLAHARLRKNNKHAGGEACHSNRYGFSGKIRCGECGAGFVGRFRYLKDGTKLRRWSCGTVVREGANACGVGMLVRDDDAGNMLMTALRSLHMDRDTILRNVLEAIQAAEGVDTERLAHEMKQVQKKKEAGMDSFFSGDISKEDLVSMMRLYEGKLDNLRERLAKITEENKDTEHQKDMIRSEVTALLNGKKTSEVFSKTILESLTVFKDRHMKLRLNCLPQVFHFH